MLSSILSMLATAALVAILAAASPLLIQGFAWLKTKTTNEIAKSAIGLVEHFSLIVVQQLEATMRPKLVREDGKLVPVAAQQLQQAALSAVKQSLLKEGSEAALKALSMGDGYLSAAIEASLASVKRAEAVAAAPVAAVVAAANPP